MRHQRELEPISLWARGGAGGMRLAADELSVDPLVDEAHVVMLGEVRGREPATAIPVAVIVLVVVGAVTNAWVLLVEILR
jgi:hypothetical protein